MAPERVTLTEVDQAEAELAAAKKTARGGGRTLAPERKTEYQEAVRRVVAVRQAYRLQEEAAGNRTSLVAGDAFVVGVDCPKCDLTSVPPDELRTHLLIEHGGKS